MFLLSVPELVKHPRSVQIYTFDFFQLREEGFPAMQTLNSKTEITNNKKIPLNSVLVLSTWGYEGDGNLYSVNCAGSNNFSSQQYEKTTKHSRISPCQSPYLDKKDRNKKVF